MTVFKFKINNKKFLVNVRECKNFFSKVRGLMFKKNSIPLLFIFKKPNKSSIHSFFCIPFIAIWLLDDKIIEIMLIKPSCLIKPKKTFNKLLEIPKNTKEFSIFYKFADDGRKI